MLVLGLLLILGATVITVGAVYDAGEEATVEILGQTLTTTAAGVFVAGAVTMLMFMIGVWALMASMGRAKRKRGERKEAKLRHRDSVRSLEEERASLRAENERLAEQLETRRGTTDTTGTSTGTGAGVAGGAAAAGAATHDRDRDGVDDRAEPGDQGEQRSFMDRVTGRHDTTDGSTTTPTARPAEHQDDRVIDHRTDLTSHETSTSGRNRDI
ncbi:MAG TPA: hypothetical protein VF423_10455 [Actinomycetes bacterium]